MGLRLVLSNLLEVRQCNPIAQYIVLLYAEGLTSLLNKEVGRSSIHAISHLLFADDCIFSLNHTHRWSMLFYLCYNNMKFYLEKKWIFINLKWFLIKIRITLHEKLCQALLVLVELQLMPFIGFTYIYWKAKRLDFSISRT